MDLQKNGLVIADLHLQKNDRYSPEEGFRLKVQPIKLMERMERLIQERDIGFVAILGDLLDTPASLPEENSILDSIFARMNAWGIPILYILGQHDVNLNKYDSDNIDYSDRSNVNVLAEHYSNIQYVHNTYMNWYGKKVYFSNFSDPIIYPKEHVDLWLTHCSIGFVKIEDEMFDMMIAGDIHDHKRSGKCYTVGTPYQHKAHEQSVGVIGYVENKDGIITFERLASDDEYFSFLKFEAPKKEFETVDSTGKKVVVDISTDTFLNELHKVLEERGLLDIHRKISSVDAPNPVNLNFTLKKLIINDFRSVKEYTLDFTSFRKVLSLFGKYGSGKSTLVTALKEVLIGDTKSIGENVSYWAKNCRLELELEYENKTYKIIRGKSLFEFYINDELQNLNNAKQTEAYMRDCLPFIEYIDILIPPSGTRIFSKEVGQRLLERCINLDLFGYYRDSAINLSKIYSEETNKLRYKIDIEKAKLQEIFLTKEQYVQEYNKNSLDIKYDKSFLLAKKEVLELYSKDLHSLYGSKESVSKILGSYNIVSEIDVDALKEKNNSLSQLIDDIKENEVKLSLAESMNNKLVSLRQVYSNLSSSLKQIDNLPQETLSQLKQQKQEASKINEEVIRFNTEIEMLRTSLLRDKLLIEDGIKNGNYICPTCGQQVIKNTDHLKVELDSVLKKINELPELKAKIDTTDLDNKIMIWEAYNNNEEINKKLQDIILEANDYKKRLSELNIKDYSNYNIVHLYSERDNNQNIINNYDKYLESKKLLEGIEESIRKVNLNIKENVLDNLSLEDSLSLIQSNLSKIEHQEKMKEFIKNSEDNINNINRGIDEITNEVKQREIEEQKWIQYIKLMDHTDLDSLPYSLFEKLVCNFNTDEFKILTNRVQKNKKVVYDINLMLKTNDKFWVSYKNGSGGQQLLMELILFDIVSSFLGRIGLLVLDESLNSASEDLYTRLNEMLSRMSFNKIILISHNQRLSCYDKLINVSIDNTGVSTYS